MDMSQTSRLESSANSDPLGKDTSWNALSRKYALKSVVRVLVTTVFGVAPILWIIGWVVKWSYGLDEYPVVVVSCILGIQLIWRVCYAPVAALKTKYAVYEDCIYHKGGVLGRWEHVAPISRVQQVSSSSGPLDRAMGLRSVEVRTADGTATSIDGLDISIAERLRDYVGRAIEVPVQREISQPEEVPHHSETLTDSTSQQSGSVCVESLPMSQKATWLRFRCHIRNIVGILPMSLIAWPLAILVTAVLIFEFIEANLQVIFVDLFGTLFLLSWGSVVLVGLVYPLIEVPLRGVALRSDDVLFKKGVLTQNVEVVPFSCIQNVESNQGFLDRCYGLSNLSIYTTASSTALEGLDTHTANYLRKEILKATQV